MRLNLRPSYSQVVHSELFASAIILGFPRYRMHPSIRSFPSAQFYESMLEDQVLIEHRRQLDCIWPQKKGLGWLL